MQNLPSYLDQTASIRYACTVVYIIVSSLRQLNMYICIGTLFQLPGSSSYRSGSLLMSVNIENTFESTGDVDYLLEEYPVNIYFNTHEQVNKYSIKAFFYNMR